MSTELAVQEIAPLALAGQLASYAQERALFIQWVREQLVPGVDYLLIHRGACAQKKVRDKPRCDTCGGKATLCKPGAEKVCSLFQVREVFTRDQDTWEMLGAMPGTLALLCQLVDRSGVVCAEGRGARKVSQDSGDINKAIKMTQKSAHIDATLRFKGLSELFTQDLEDNGPTPEEKYPPLRLRGTKPEDTEASEGERPAGPAGRAAGPAVTGAEVEELEGSIRKLAKAFYGEGEQHFQKQRDQVKQAMMDRFHTDQYSHLTRDDFEIVKGWVAGRKVHGPKGAA